MAGRGSLDPVIHRGIKDDEFKDESDVIGIACQYCDSRNFYVSGVKGERNLRLICDCCDTIQTEFIGLYLGTIGGTT